ncbi:MAG: hypothetical protein U5L05_00990 [Rubrivivax sp.]|nr:hypothetical protein [Rubrivivax sp.]
MRVAAGHALATRLRRACDALATPIVSAVADIVPGMGYDLPLALLTRFADGMAEKRCARE